MSETLEKPVAYKSPLHEMTQTTPTCLWNDSATLSELTYSIEHGGVGATCNPVIVLDALKKEAHLWNDRIRALAVEMPAATEEEIGWRLVEEISAKRSELLRPAFEQYRGRNGRLSIQTDPHYYRDTAALLQQAVRFDALAPNMIVKIPATRAGISAIEEATYRGISINATVSFALPQCIAVAEAMERGFQRREKEGHDISRMGPVCTVMARKTGRLAESGRRKAGYYARTRLPGMGGSCGVQEGVQNFSGTRLSCSPALGGVPQPHAVERAGRRRCSHFSAL